MKSDTMVPKVARMQIREARNHGTRAVTRKEAKGKIKVPRGSRAHWTRGKTGHTAAWCRKGGNTDVYAVDEDDGH